MDRDLLNALTDSIERREAVALVTVTAATGPLMDALGCRAVVWPQPDRQPVGDLKLGALESSVLADVRRAILDKGHRHLDYTEAGADVSIFVEVQQRPPHLIIVGAGHIAVPLASVAKICDFLVTVLDDRAQYAHPARFPTADRVIAGPFRAELDKLRQGKAQFDNDTYIVLVTRGHQYDVESLLEVLDDPLAYIGMIGSQRRIRAVFELLEKEQGIPAEKFDRVYAPIGLDIGAITPAEIGVCIMAEIINVMRGGPAEGLSGQIRREREERRQRVSERKNLTEI
ncbi:MAG: XdhC family protein [Caldilineaceae bacterium]|nr:XdhC family protein [Caldilineaceae bacterium]